MGHAERRLTARTTVTLPKPQTSEAKSEGRFGKQDFRYVAEEDIYICPAGEKLIHRFAIATLAFAKAIRPLNETLHYPPRFSKGITASVRFSHGLDTKQTWRLRCAMSPLRGKVEPEGLSP